MAPDVATPTQSSSKASSHASSSTPTSATVKTDDKKIKRGVRQLTDQQLAKKRQNDREAQRAIRERTRTTIEALERKVKDLESGQPYRQVQDLVHEKDAMRAENEELRRRLASIMAIIEPVLGSTATPSQPQSIPSIRTSLDMVRASANVPPSPLPGPPLSIQTGHGHALDSRDRQREHHFHSANSTWRHQERLRKPSQGEDQYAMDASYETKPFQSRSVSPRSRSDSASLFYTPSIYRPGTRGSMSHSPQPAPSNMPSPSDVMLASSSKAYACLPLHVQPTCPFDKILLDFLTESRKRIAAGEPVDDILGPPYPDMTDLVYPQMEGAKRPHSLSSLLIETLKGFTSIQTFVEKVGICAMSYYNLRWQISPTPENYDLVSPQLKPTEDQLRIAHPIWIDIVEWPGLRSKLVQHFHSVPLDSFFFPLTVQVSVNWTHPNDPWRLLTKVRRPATGFDADCRDAGGFTEELRPSEEFEQHLRNLDNWTVGPQFAEAFPWLAHTVKIAYG